MDRSTEPHNAPGNPTQPSGPVPAQDSHQEPPPQASSSRPIYQPIPTLAQNAPQTASITTGVGPRGPPTPAKSEADRAFRASRPISRPTSSSSEGHYVDAPDAPTGLTNPPREQPSPREQSPPREQPSPREQPPLREQPPPREQPSRRGSTLPPRTPTVIVTRGYNENGTYRLAEPPLAAPPPTRRYGSALDWVIGGSDKHTPYVVSAALPF